MSIGIDIGSTGLKVVQVGGLAGRVVVNGAARWIPAAGGVKDDREAGEALRAIVSRAPHVPSTPVLGVTGRDVNLQYTFMPPVSPQIFRAMMRHEIDQIAGPGGSEIFVDYCVTNEPPRKGGKEGEYSVVIGRAKRQVVEDRLAIARDAGMSAPDACPNAIALFQAVVASRQAGANETLLALDLGAENLEGVLIQGNRLLFARNVSSGARLFTEAVRTNLNVPLVEAERLKVKHANLGHAQEAETIPGLAGAVRTAAGQLSNVIQSSIIAFARLQLKRPDLKVSKCLLSGGGARLHGLQAYLQGSLGIPVEWLQPFQHLDCSGLPADVVQSLQATPTDMAIALGLALAGSPRGAPVRLSLLPAGQKAGRAQRRRIVLTVAAGILYILGLTALAVGAFNDRSDARDRLDQAKAILKRYEDRLQEFNDVVRKQAIRKAQGQLLRNEVLVGRALLESLARLQRLLPEGMWVASIACDRRAPAEGPNAGKGIEVKIRGQADEGKVRNPYELLRKIASDLGDPGAGVTAEASEYKPAPRAGWGEFVFTLVIPQFVPAPEKPAGEEEQEEEAAADATATPQPPASTGK
jgi:type IV pilus assembly protein PilM